MISQAETNTRMPPDFDKFNFYATYGTNREDQIHPTMIVVKILYNSFGEILQVCLAPALLM